MLDAFIRRRSKVTVALSCFDSARGGADLVRRALLGSAQRLSMSRMNVSGSNQTPGAALEVPEMILCAIGRSDPL